MGINKTTYIKQPDPILWSAGFKTASINTTYAKLPASLIINKGSFCSLVDNAGTKELYLYKSGKVYEAVISSVTVKMYKQHSFGVGDTIYVSGTAYTISFLVTTNISYDVLTLNSAVSVSINTVLYNISDPTFKSLTYPVQIVNEDVDFISEATTASINVASFASLDVDKLPNYWDAKTYPFSSMISKISIVAGVAGTTFDVPSFPTSKVLYVDNQRTDAYIENGSVAYPYKTLDAALTWIKANYTAATDKQTTKYVVHLAPGVYNENIEINNAKYIRFEGIGVTLSGTIFINQTPLGGSGQEPYGRVEFVGTHGYRAEKGASFDITGAITMTRTNDSLSYVTFKGCYVTGAILADVNGTWVLHFVNSRCSGTISETFTGAGTPAILIESTEKSEFTGAMSGKISLYDCINTDFYCNMTITPPFDCTLRSCLMPSGTISIIETNNINIDLISYKALESRTPTLTGMTYVHLEPTEIANLLGVKRYKALLTQRAPVASQTSGTVLVGSIWTITTFAAGDDFSNWELISGTANTTGAVYRALTTAPTVWVNGSDLTNNGAPFVVSLDVNDDINPSENSLGVVSYEYTSDGEFNAVSSGLFTTGKTYAKLISNYGSTMTGAMIDSENAINLSTGEIDAGVFTLGNDLLDNCYFEIEVYP